MQENNLKDQDAAKLNRRKFLTRAGVGLVVASLPAKSVWASSSGLAGSIIASGHGSDFTSGNPIKLQSPGYFKNSMTSQNGLTFASIFGGPLIDVKSNTSRVTLGEVLDQPGKKHLGGTNNINFNLVGMYLNAYFGSGRGTGIIEPNLKLYFPVVGPDKPFKSLSDFALYLYAQALANPRGVSTEIDMLINKSGMHGI